MEQDKAYLKFNKELWNQKTEIHVDSEFYEMNAFLAGKNSLKDIEKKLLGDISGKKILHLQCHFGQDSLSLARMGAEVTGVDLSSVAIQKAKDLSNQLNLPAQFICSDVFQLDQHLDEKFDIVFTSYGVIGWLPELNNWARIIHHFLKPGGKFLIVEFHPIVWMFDDDFENFAYSYFNKETIIEETEGTYADRSAPIKAKAYGWNHSLGDVIGSLLEKGLKITHFEEFDYSPYDCFNKIKAVEDGYQIEGLEGKIPMIFAIEAEQPE